MWLLLSLWLPFQRQASWVAIGDVRHLRRPLMPQDHFTSLFPPLHHSSNNRLLDE